MLGSFFAAVFHIARRESIARKKSIAGIDYFASFNLLVLAAANDPVDINLLRIVDRRVHVDIDSGHRGCPCIS
jgi:hypothetical protein